MKYFKRLGQYKASNVRFEIDTCRAYSYDWWRFVDKVNGKVVFNCHNYSISTSKHQRKVRQLLQERYINIDCFVSVETGLQDSDAGLLALKNAYRDQEDLVTINKIKEIYQVSLTEDEIQKIYDEKEESLCLAFLEKAVVRQKKKQRKIIELGINYIHKNYPQLNRLANEPKLNILTYLGE